MFKNVIEAKQLGKNFKTIKYKQKKKKKKEKANVNL